NRSLEGRGADAEVVVAGVDFPALVEEADAALNAEDTGAAEGAGVERCREHERLARIDIGPAREVEAEVGRVAVGEHARAESRAHLYLLVLAEEIGDVQIAQPQVIGAAARQVFMDMAPIRLHAEAAPRFEKQTQTRSIDAVEIVAFFDRDTAGPAARPAEVRLRRRLFTFRACPPHPHVTRLALGVGIRGEIGIGAAAVSTVTIKK